MDTHPPILDRINRLRAADRRSAARPSESAALAGPGLGRPGGARVDARARPVVSFHPPTGSRRLVDHRAEIAQLVEHATENRGVASSNLALGTTSRVGGSRAEVAQLVEHHLAKVRVAGSSPVFRSNSSVLRAAAPSSSGRTADFGSVNRGSNPRGAASIRRTIGANHIWRRGEVAQHGGLQNLYSPVRIRSSPPQSEHETALRGRCHVWQVIGHPRLVRRATTFAVVGESHHQDPSRPLSGGGAPSPSGGAIPAQSRPNVS